MCRDELICLEIDLIRLRLEALRGVPVHTLLLWSVSMTSCTPGRCAPPPFMQTQFIKSSQLGIFFVLRRCCK